MFRREESGGFVPLKVGSRAEDILGILIEKGGDLVSKDEIIAKVWSGTIVEESNLTVQISTLRRFLDDRSAESCIQTVPGRGYRFVAPITRCATDISGTPAGIDAAPPSGVTAIVAEEPEGPLPLPDRPSIAVLPFANMSADAEQDYFADGISEDIITGLSKLHWFFVIARNSSFTYKGRAVDIRQVGRELGVRYVLEGSVRKGGNRVRITAQLIDAVSGKHLWADRYDGELVDIFALQDEITRKVVAAIEPKLMEAEGIRSQNRSPKDLGAWDMLIRASSLFWRLTKDESQAAIALLKQLIERHPLYAPAHGMLAFVLLVSRQGGWHMMDSPKRQASLRGRWNSTTRILGRILRWAS
ncbi:MAG TPA: winged helix-turn-helix domain-containing protein [Candidatus Acidoferrales bacterium]|nr:winged helix-turn-helix domain-containing protein [Candidatus Acidoferrales bacterium]